LTLVYVSLGALVIGAAAGWVVRSREAGPSTHVASDHREAPVGNGGQAPEHFIVFSAESEPLAATPDLLPADAGEIYCFYRLPETYADSVVSAHCWHNGEDLGDIETSAASVQSVPYLVLKPPGGAESFSPGIYEVELAGPERDLGRGSFVVAEDAAEIMAGKPSLKGRTRVVSCVTTRRVNKRGEPEEPQAVFAGTDKVYVAFAYINGTAGGKIGVLWHCDGRPIEAALQELEMKGGAGRGFAWMGAGRGRLPAGKYCVTLYLQGVDKSLAQANFTVQP
jgi:hypothetical protein